jgi:lysophospholipase L1-like esterase
MNLAMRYLLVALALVAQSFASAAQPDFARWEKEIAGIEQRDAQQKPMAGGIVFVGSSSIRLWELDKSFPDLPVANHGFGGSTIADSVHFFDRLVTPLKPKTIVFYAGDNDLANGLSTEQVHDDFDAFLGLVNEKLPEAKVIYLPIKPSPSRFKLLEKQQQANKAIKQSLASKTKHGVYLDTVAPMLDDNGQPRPELFRNDKLHLNDTGYELWTKLLRPLLVESEK